jgi:hypothetical protein
VNLAFESHTILEWQLYAGKGSPKSGDWRSCLGIFGQRPSATFVTFREFLPLNTLGSMEVHRDDDSRPLLLSGHAAERRWPRYKVDVPLQLATQGLTNGIILQGRGSELNCGGMAVSGRIELAIGEQVTLSSHRHTLDNR